MGDPAKLSPARLLALFGLAATLIAPLPARAGTCSLSGANGTFKVAKLTTSGAPVSVSWQQRDPIDSPLRDKDKFVVNLALFVFSGSGSPDVSVVDYFSSGSPHAVVQVNGQTQFNSTVPSTRESGKHGALEA